MSFPHGRTGSTLTVDERPLGVATEEAESSLSEYRHQTIVVERRRVISGGNKKVGNRITTEREAKVVSTRKLLKNGYLVEEELLKHCQSDSIPICGEMASSKHDVIVVGAGLSGLSAATILKARCPDLDVLVLESGDRVGGRTYSVDIKAPDGTNDVLDLGAHWVGSTQKEVLEVMKHYGVDYYKQNINGTKVFLGRDGVARPYSSILPDLNSWFGLIDLGFFYASCERQVQKVDYRDPFASPLAGRLDSMSGEVFVRQYSDNQNVMDMANAACRAVLGCDMAQVSALYFVAYAASAGSLMRVLLADESSGQGFNVAGGTQQMSLKMADEIGVNNVILGKRAIGISQDSEISTVECVDGTKYSADHVITTISASQTASIKFKPPLPIGRQSLNKQAFLGNLMKVYVVYREAFWTKMGYSGEIVSSGSMTDNSACESAPISITYDATTKKGTPVLIGFIGGYCTDQWMARSKDERRDACIKQLVQCFGKEAANYIEYIEFNWMEESVAHICGAPGLVMPSGSMHNFHYVGRPHGRRVHFAGTETGAAWAGFMSGAIEAGWRAAAEVIEAERPSSLTEEDKARLAQSRAQLEDSRRGEIMRKNRTWRGKANGRDNENTWLLVATGLGIATGYCIHRLRVGDIFGTLFKYFVNTGSNNF